MSGSKAFCQVFQIVDRKDYIKCDSNTFSDDIFALLDAVNSDVEEEIARLNNKCDNEFVAIEERVVVLQQKTKRKSKTW